MNVSRRSVATGSGPEPEAAMPLLGHLEELRKTLVRCAIVGVILDPRQNELFSAVLGRGAFLNDKPIRVSTVSGVADGMISTRRRGPNTVMPVARPAGSRRDRLRHSAASADQARSARRSRRHARSARGRLSGTLRRARRSARHPRHLSLWRARRPG